MWMRLPRRSTSSITPISRSRITFLEREALRYRILGARRRFTIHDRSSSDCASISRSRKMLCLLLFSAMHTVVSAPNVEYRQPQLAARAGVVGMTFGAGNRIFYADSRDGGRTFSVPVTVAELGALALGRHRGPRVVFTRDAIVISAVAGARVSQGPHAHGLPENGDLLVWRSA